MRNHKKTSGKVKLLHPKSRQGKIPKREGRAEKLTP